MLSKEKIKDIFGYIFTFVFAVFISTSVLFSYQVSGDSMSPTLRNGERGLALRTGLIQNPIGRFDIVVIEKGERYLVKRVIGLPNEKVEYKDNKLYIDGKFIEEDFLNNTTTEDFNYLLGNNEYYCLGDNRQHSADSRTYGAFTKDVIKAVLFK